MTTPARTTPALTIVVAVQHSAQNLPAILDALQPARHGDVEFIVCHGAADPAVARLVPERENLRTLAGAPGDLIPQMWRDGIRAATAELVALTTAHCIPAADWIDQLMRCDMAGRAGIGGVIEGHPASDAKGWAIHLLRYAAFSPPRQPGEVSEIAADNALYLRPAILRHGALLEIGFFEPSFHARFAAEGLGLALNPALRVAHLNRYGARQFMGQRWAHGKQYGLDRARTSGAGRRALLIALAPLIPLVYFAKLSGRILSQRTLRAHYPRALPWLLLFMLSWNAGEILGYFTSIFDATE